MVYCKSHCTFQTIDCILVKGRPCEQCGKWQRTCVCSLSLVGFKIEGNFFGGWQVHTCSIACIDCILGLQFIELNGCWSVVPRITQGKEGHWKVIIVCGTAGPDAVLTGFCPWLSHLSLAQSEFSSDLSSWRRPSWLRCRPGPADYWATAPTCPLLDGWGVKPAAPLLRVEPVLAL